MVAPCGSNGSMTFNLVSPWPVGCRYDGNDMDQLGLVNDTTKLLIVVVDLCPRKFEFSQ